MSMTRTLIALSLMMLMAGHAAAHHNWAALYDVNSDIEIEGVISSIVWRNPHVRISFTVDAGTADEKVYVTESNSVAALTRMNITKDVLAVGAQVGHLERGGRESSPLRDRPITGQGVG